MKKWFKKIHLYLAIPVGLIISLVCFTGAILVFEKEITRAFQPELYEVDVPANAVKLTPSALLEKVRSQVPDTLVVKSVQFSADASATAVVGFENAGRKKLSVNPYTGKVNGWIESSKFFSDVRKLHRWLLNAPKERGAMTVGKMIVGVATLLFVFILLSGLFIWIPRSWKGVRNHLKVSFGKGKIRFFYDTHVALGFYALLFLLLMALTGLTWSFGWYRSATYALFGVQQEQGGMMRGASQEGKKKEGKKHGKEGKVPYKHRDAEDQPKPEVPSTDFTVWDKVMAQLQSTYAQAEYMEVSTEGAEVATNKPGYARKYDRIEYEQASGNITKIDRYDDRELSRRMHGLLYALHTGVWGGLWSKILYFLAALIGGTLPLTGYYLWWKRISKKKRKAVR